MARKIWWTDYSASDYGNVDPERTIAILPIAAVEQHGPHLPVGVDSILNRGCLDLLIERAPADLDLRIRDRILQPVEETECTEGEERSDQPGADGTPLHCQA